MPNKKKEITGYVLRPEAVPFLGEIHWEIERTGLVISASKLLMLPPWVIPEIYPNVPPERHPVITKHLTLGECEVGLVTGVDAIDRFFKLVGTDTDPRMCGEFTIRHRYGIGGSFDGGYHPNGVHRPEDAEEAARDVVVIRRLLQGSA